VEFLHAIWSRSLADPFTVGVEPASRTRVRQWQPTSMRLTSISPPSILSPCCLQSLPQQEHPSVLHAGRTQREKEAWEERTFSQSRMEHCVVVKEQRVSPQERRPEHDGTVRVVYAARIADCRSCPIRPQCQEHGISTKKPRRVSAVLHPLPEKVPEPPLSGLSALGSHPVLWGDWSRSHPRRDWIDWQRSHLVTVEVAPVSPPSGSPPSTFSRAERACCLS
jgi:hypothetical protein